MHTKVHMHTHGHERTLNTRETIFETWMTIWNWQKRTKLTYTRYQKRQRQRRRRRRRRQCSVIYRRNILNTKL